MQQNGRIVVRNRNRYRAATVLNFDRFPASTCSRMSLVVA